MGSSTLSSWPVMLQRQFILEPEVDYSLYVTAKQYWHSELEVNWSRPDALTLLLLHSTSFHKETWEPTLQHLFEDLLKYQTYATPRIKSAWVIECPNHGESAVLNVHALQRPPFHRNFGCEKYAEAVHRFMRRGPVDFENEKLVGIGHSLGGVGMLFRSILPTLLPAFHFHALVLIEPLLSPQGIDKLRDLQAHLIHCAYERRNVWPSRQRALQYLRERTEWNPRVLDSYVQFGLKPCEGVDYQAVTLACSREEEATMYGDMTGSQRGIESLNKLSETMPIGVIFGDKNDYIPRHVQEALVDPASGRCIRAVSRMEGVGHLIPQHMPAKLSRVMLEILCRLVTPGDTLGKL